MADQPNSIFDGNANPVPPNPDVNNSDTSNIQPPPNDRVADLLKDIRNERGEQKYKDPLEALNGLKHAQEFIPQLKSQLTDKEQEIARLREEVNRLKEVESSVQKLTQPNSDPQPTAQGTMTEEQIAELVARQLTKKEQESLQKQNLQTVVSTLRSVLGTDAEKTFYAKAAELGMTQEEINGLAATKPKAVLTMFGVTDKQAAAPSAYASAPQPSSVNSSAFQQTEESYVGRNPKPTLIGATTDDLKQATDRAKKMVDELSKHGLSINDLTNPKVYSKYFK